MATKRMNTKMLEKISSNISKNAEVTENKAKQSFVDEGLKITSLSFKVIEYEKIKRYCEKMIFLWLNLLRVCERKGCDLKRRLHF